MQAGLVARELLLLELELDGNQPVLQQWAWGRVHTLQKLKFFFLDNGRRVGPGSSELGTGSSIQVVDGRKDEAGSDDLELTA